MLEAQIEDLTHQNAELLLRNSGQSHPEVNRDELEEEERNSHTNAQDRWENDYQEGNLLDVNPRELRNRRAICHGD